MITNLSTKRICDRRETNTSKSFTHKMAAKTSLHRYGTKLRHCHRMYNLVMDGGADVEMGVATARLRVRCTLRQCRATMSRFDRRPSRDVDAQTAFHFEASAPQCCNSCLGFSQVPRFRPLAETIRQHGTCNNGPVSVCLR